MKIKEYEDPIDSKLATVIKLCRRLGKEAGIKMQFYYNFLSREEYEIFYFKGGDASRENLVVIASCAELNVSNLDTTIGNLRLLLEEAHMHFHSEERRKKHGRINTAPYEKIVEKDEDDE